MKPRPRVKPTNIVDIDLQCVVERQDPQFSHVPGDEEFEVWANACVAGEGHDHAILTIRIVDESEMTGLNSTYRQKSGPTNVLSFPCDLPPEMAQGFIGDVVICAPVVAREAAEQSKPVAAHWCHMVVHGILHLLGHDHEEDEQARLMERREREILAQLGFNDPYGDDAATV